MTRKLLSRNGLVLWWLGGWGFFATVVLLFGFPLSHIPIYAIGLGLGLMIGWQHGSLYERFNRLDNRYGPSRKMESP